MQYAVFSIQLLRHTYFEMSWCAFFFLAEALWRHMNFMNAGSAKTIKEGRTIVYMTE